MGDIDRKGGMMGEMPTKINMFLQKGRTALDIARSHDKSDVVEFLEAAAVGR